MELVRCNTCHSHRHTRHSVAAGARHGAPIKADGSGIPVEPTPMRRRQGGVEARRDGRGARRPSRWLPVLGMVLCGACSSTAEPPAETEAPAILGPAGGTVVLVGGALTVSAAPGALAQEVRVRASPSGTHPGSHLLIPGTAWHVAAEPSTTAAFGVSVRLAESALPPHLRPAEVRVHVLRDGFWRAAAGAGPPTAGMAAAVLPLPATVALLGVPAATVDVRPAQVRLELGASTALSAVVRDADGATLPARAVLWTTSKPTVAVVDDGGVVTAVGPGIAHIGARAGDAVGSNSVTVAPGG